jgi:lipoprotein-releasing system permease protein
MLALRIAMRFLTRSKGQSVLILVGIGIGIAVQVFVGSLITSLQASLIDRTVGSSSHVTLEPLTVGGTVPFTESDRKTLEADPAITAVAPQQTVSALVTEGGASVPLVLKGGAFADLDGIYKLSDKLVEGSAALTGDDILIGTAFAEDNGVSVGENLALTLAGGATLGTKVAGIVDLGSAAANSQIAFVDGGLARTALGRPEGEYSLVETQITDVFASTTVAQSLQAEFPQAKVTDWQVENSELLTALQSQSTSSYMIQFFVIVAVMLGIASTLAISAVQKTRQIGILKALGMTDRRTGGVFLIQAGTLGVLGTALGIGIGLGLIALFGAFAGSSSSSFPITAQPAFLVLSAVIGIGIALLSAIIPYRRTSRIDPIEVIQGG